MDTKTIYESKISEILKNRFKILEQLGQGGMGRVYKVEDISSGEIFALKLVHPELSENETILKRLKRELEVTANTDSKHLVKTYDLDRVEDISFITMEFIEGATLGELLKKRGHLDTHLALKYGLQILEGLKVAHGGQVIHRDLKPGNIMVDSTGRVVITDFGLAKPVGDVTKLSKTSDILGTPQYVAPEQWRGQVATVQTDIYAFGVILYEMLCGKTPFIADSEFGYLQQHLNSLPEFKEEKLIGLPPFVKQIIEKCLEKSPSKRYANVDEIIGDISRKRVKGVATSKLRRVAKRVPEKLLVSSLIMILAVSTYLGFRKYGTEKRPERLHFAVLPFQPLCKEKKVVSWSRKLPEFISSDLSQEKKISITPHIQIRGQVHEKSPNEARRLIFEKTGVQYLVTGTVDKNRDKYLFDVEVYRKGDTHHLFAKFFETKGKSLFALNSRISRSIKEHLGIKPLENITYKELNSVPITTNSQDAKEYYILAINNDQKGKYIEAIEFLEKAIELDNQFASAYLQLATCQEVLLRYAKAKESLKKAKVNINHISDYEKLRIKDKIEIVCNRNYVKAHKIRQVLYKKYPNHINTINMLATSYINFEQWPEAETLLFKSSKIGSNEGTKKLIALYIKTNQIKKARSRLNSIKIPEDFDWYSFYDWTISIRERDFKRAITLSEQRIFEHTKDEKSYRYAGLSYLFNENYFKAIESFNHTIGLKISEDISIKHMVYKAIVYLHMGLIRKAEATLKEAIELSEKFSAHNYHKLSSILLSRIYLLTERYSEATKTAKKASDKIEYLNLNKDPLLILSKGICHFKNGSLKGLVNCKVQMDGINKNYKGFKIRICRYMMKSMLKLFKKQSSPDSLIKLLKLYKGEINSSGDDHHALIHHLIAEHYKLSQNREKELETYKKIQNLTFGRIQYGDIYSLSYYRAGCILQSMDRKTEAIKEFKKFLQLWGKGDRDLLPQIEDTENRLAKLST